MTSWALGMLNEVDFSLIEIRVFQKVVLSASASSFKCVFSAAKVVVVLVEVVMVVVVVEVGVVVVVVCDVAKRDLDWTWKKT